MSKKKGAGDEGDENEEGILDLPPAESLPISTVVSTVPAATDQFMFTDDFKRLLVGFVMGDTLMTLSLTTKTWKRVVDAFIDEGVKSGEIIVHDGEGIDWEEVEAQEERRELITRVDFLLNIMTVGDRACAIAVNLVIVEIPKGVESIGDAAFNSCFSLTAVSFPTTLKQICECTFVHCASLESVDLLHTSLQEIGNQAFLGCSELKSMTIPDSLQTLHRNIFANCFKLVPSNINDADSDAVVAHLRSFMFYPTYIPNDFLNTDDFRKYFLRFVLDDTLMVLRLATKAWKRVADAFIDKGVKSGAIIVHSGEDHSWKNWGGDSLSPDLVEEKNVLEERRALAMRVVFCLNITKVGRVACMCAVNLVTVDIPYGVKSICGCAFVRCSSLTTVSFPTTLTSIGHSAFYDCSSLDNIDLLHTNLQELGLNAFEDCSELKSMTIPDSLQTLGYSVFWNCSKLVPSNINVTNQVINSTPEVVAHLRSLQT
ncbi:hypothetical protein TL16_g01511 [Triparma laevis f. inornata]|uniref:Uncharacterized protein n=1 Tax=Triparma laevis f. inornata TaxID=1714386 RepID=A0A9W7DRN6_9STRA|nr:hypothetical protein TL16_g01511 [Triparma laevis f. inornata]